MNQVQSNSALWNPISVSLLSVGVWILISSMSAARRLPGGERRKEHLPSPPRYLSPATTILNHSLISRVYPRELSPNILIFLLGLSITCLVLGDQTQVMGFPITCYSFCLRCWFWIIVGQFISSTDSDSQISFPSVSA